MIEVVAELDRFNVGVRFTGFDELLRYITCDLQGLGYGTPLRHQALQRIGSGEIEAFRQLLYVQNDLAFQASKLIDHSDNGISDPGARLNDNLTALPCARHLIRHWRVPPMVHVSALFQVVRSAHLEGLYMMCGDALKMAGGRKGWALGKPRIRLRGRAPVWGPR